MGALVFFIVTFLMYALGSFHNKYHWEIRFEFVEKMETLQRTWKIPVKL